MPDTTNPRAKSKRVPAYLLGKHVGTRDGSQAWVEEDGDVMFGLWGFRRNMLGKSAFPGFKDGMDLAFELWGGWAKQFPLDCEDPSFQDGPEITVNWAMFAE